ncbi:MAG: transglutaminase domain-containing protein [Candidatus Portnoybacteria bacterium]|nr:transglutaminase domain-containing protein [Candidatus Portnoybacteria bacterium]
MTKTISPKHFLQSGEQTKITPKIKKIAKRLLGRNDYETAFNTFRWIKANLKHIQSWPWRRDNLRKRTAAQVIKSKKASGCGDRAVVFASLMRANGIPAKIVEALDTEWLKSQGEIISGHVFVDLYIDRQWRITDPTVGTINLDYAWPAGKRFTICWKGLDSWELGIKDFKDLKKYCLKVREAHEKL